MVRYEAVDCGGLRYLDDMDRHAPWSFAFLKDSMLLPRANTSLKMVEAGNKQLLITNDRWDTYLCHVSRRLGGLSLSA